MASVQDFKSLLAKTGIPEAGLKPLTAKVDEYVSLVTQSNEMVAAINAAKAQDPSNVDFLDTRWRANENDERIAETVTKFDAIAEEYERLLKQLRETAREHFVPQPLSEDDAKNKRKQVNEMAPTIAETRKGIQAQLEMVENILKLTGTELPDGGLINYLPNADSLKSARGRKAVTASGEVKQYVTRVGEVLLDGKSTNIDGKGKIAYAANSLTEKFNGKTFPQNKVTAEEIEEAYFASRGLENRAEKSTELPDEHTFTFSKTVVVQNTNDDGTTEVPQNVKVTIRSVNFGESKAEAEKPAEAPKTESAPAENNKPKSEPMKIDTRTEAQKEAAAKKTAAPTKK